MNEYKEYFRYVSPGFWESDGMRALSCDTARLAYTALVYREKDDKRGALQIIQAATQARTEGQAAAIFCELLDAGLVLACGDDCAAYRFAFEDDSNA